MYKLHYFPDTASVAVRMVLLELGAAHELHLIDRASGALDSAAYRALQPMGKIPALETPDGPMFETAAILLYLCDKHGQLAPAPDAPERAAFLAWLFFTSTNLHPTLLQLFYPERTAGPDCTAQVLAHARAQLQSQLALLNAMLTKQSPAWFGTAPSLMGYYLGMLMHWLGSNPPDHPGYFATADFPALHARLAALETRAAAQSVAADESLGALPFTQPNA